MQIPLRILLLSMLASVACGSNPSQPTSTTTTTVPTTASTGPAPIVLSIDPAIGSSDGGTPITITGTDFTNVSAVRFGTIAATSFTVDSDTSITATAPAGAPGVGDVVVVAAGGTSATSDDDVFTWNPNPLMDLTLSANLVVAGSPLRGTVTLTYPAPSGGLYVPLTWESDPSHSTAILMPLNAFVAANQASGSFQITTFFTSVEEQIVVTGERWGEYRSAPFRLTR